MSDPPNYNVHCMLIFKIPLADGSKFPSKIPMIDFGRSVWWLFRLTLALKYTQWN